MRYMMLIYLPSDGAPTEEEREQCYIDSTEFARKLQEQGKFVGAAPLHPPSTATSVRIRDGKRLVMDGPFAETREHLGGYFMVEAGDLDEAIEIAAGIPAGKWGGVEIRPVVEVPAMSGVK